MPSGAYHFSAARNDDPSSPLVTVLNPEYIAWHEQYKLVLFGSFVLLQRMFLHNRLGISHLNQCGRLFKLCLFPLHEHEFMILNMISLILPRGQSPFSITSRRSNPSLTLLRKLANLPRPKILLVTPSMVWVLPMTRLQFMCILSWMISYCQMFKVFFSTIGIERRLEMQCSSQRRFHIFVS